MNTQAPYTELIIDENGRIENINDPGNDLLGSALDSAKPRHISMIIPNLSRFPLFRKGQINSRLKYLARIGHLFEVNKSGGGCVLCRICLHVIERSGKRLVRITMLPGSLGYTVRSNPANFAHQS